MAWCWRLERIIRMRWPAAGSTGNVLALVNGADARSVALAAAAQSDGNTTIAYVLGGTRVFGQWTAERIAAKLNKHIQ